VIHGKSRGKAGESTKRGLIVALQVQPKKSPSGPTFYGISSDLWTEMRSTRPARTNLETAVERACQCRDRRAKQGARTRQAHTCKDEQRRMAR